MKKSVHNQFIALMILLILCLSCHTAEARNMVRTGGILDRPDLTVEKADVRITGTFNDRGVVEKMQVKLTITIGNNGREQAKNVFVRIERYFRYPFTHQAHFDNTYFNSFIIPSLAPGQRYTHEFEALITTEAESKFFVSVDPDNRISEIIENNNTRFSGLVSILDVSKVRVTSLYMIPERVRSGYSVTFKVRVMNGQPFTFPVKIRITSPMGGSKSLVLLDKVVELEPGVHDYLIRKPCTRFKEPVEEDFSLYVRVFPAASNLDMLRNVSLTPPFRVPVCRLDNGYYKLGPCTLGTIQPNRPSNLGEPRF